MYAHYCHDCEKFSNSMQISFLDSTEYNTYVPWDIIKDLVQGENVVLMCVYIFLHVKKDF